MKASQRLLDALKEIDSALKCLCGAVERVIRDQRNFEYEFDKHHQLSRVVPKTDFNFMDLLVEKYNPEMMSGQILQQISACAEKVWTARETAMLATDKLPDDVVSQLDALSGRPWGASLRHDLLDTVVVWPGETPSYATRGNRKVTEDVYVFLQYLANRNPLPEWQEFRATSRSLSEELVAVRESINPRRFFGLLRLGNKSPRKSTGFSADEAKEFVLAAIVRQNQYQDGKKGHGSIGNLTPLKGIEIAAACNLDPSRVSEAMKDMFGGQKEYVNLIRSNRLAKRLQELRGEKYRERSLDNWSGVENDKVATDDS